MIIIKITSRCIGRKTEARGGRGEIPAAARGDGMIGGGTPDFDDDDFDYDDFCDDDDFEKMIVLIALVFMTMMQTWNNYCQGCVWMSRGRGRQHG